MLHLEELEVDWTFKKDDSEIFNVYRTKVPGGWLLLMYKYGFSDSHEKSYGWGYGGATFLPDPNHQWDGSSLE